MISGNGFSERSHCMAMETLRFYVVAIPEEML
jgi:hypothetical protein